MTKPKFIKMPESKNRGNKFITGNPDSHKASCRAAVSTAACNVVLPASALKVVRPGECDPITVPQQPAMPLAMPVHFTSSSTPIMKPVEPSMPAMRSVNERIRTNPRPRKVANLGGSKCSTTFAGCCSVHIDQKGSKLAAGNSQPSSLISSKDKPEKATQSQKTTMVVRVGATASTRAGSPAYFNKMELSAMPTAQNSGQGLSCAAWAMPLKPLSPSSSTAKAPTKMAKPMEPRKPATTGYGR
mmetsp:Transcript_4848/g.11402  ORF Transcript_4848/g.11402 Transcript_4848/m.11402 type:complete len:243 (+) Transcript_4848:1731-2459(+)